VDQDTLVLLDCVLNEVENGFGGGVLLVEDDLVLQVEPLKRQVDHSSAFKEVLDLLACTVNNMRNLIGNYELLIL
jgi:hypothetical protein